LTNKNKINISYRIYSQVTYKINKILNILQKIYNKVTDTKEAT